MELSYLNHVQQLNYFFLFVSFIALIKLVYLPIQCLKVVSCNLYQQLMEFLILKMLTYMVEPNVFLNKFSSFYEGLFAIFVKDFQKHRVKLFRDIFELILELYAFIDTGQVVNVDFFGELDSFIFVDQVALVVFQAQKGFFPLCGPVVTHLLFAQQNPYHRVKLGSVGHGVDCEIKLKESQLGLDLLIFDVLAWHLPQLKGNLCDQKRHIGLIVEQFCDFIMREWSCKLIQSFNQLFWVLLKHFRIKVKSQY